MKRKTILFLNLRFGDFYSKDLFAQLKKNSSIRIVAVLDQQFKNKIGAHILPYLDKIHMITSTPKNGFLGEFNVEDLRPIIKEEQSKTEDLRIVCTDEFNLLLAGQLRKEFKLAGHTNSTLIPYRDKTVMKDILNSHGLRVPKYHEIKTHDNFQQLKNYLGLPFIVKPVDSCGSQGVNLIKSEAEFKAMTFGNEIFEAEEFIDGTLYHVDSLIKSKEIKFIATSEYLYPNFEYTKGKPLASIPLLDSNPLKPKLLAFAKQCLEALSADNLVNHMELFINKNNEIVFLEISARPPGALIVPSHSMNFGINLMDEDFFLQSGESIVVEPHVHNDKVFTALFPLYPGKIVNLREPKTKSRYKMSWFVERNQLVHKDQCKNIVNKAAHAIFYNSDLECLHDDFKKLKNYMAVEVE